MGVGIPGVGIKGVGIAPENASYATDKTRMWADAQRDGRPAEYRWRPLLNAANVR